MEDTAHITAWLAIGFGSYVFAAGIGGVIEPSRWARMFEEIEKSPSLQFATGVLTFLVGFAILLANPGGSTLALIVSAIGLIEAIEGLLIFIVPRPIFRLGRWIAGFGRPLYAAIALIGSGLIAVGWLSL